MADFLVTVDGKYINFAHTNGSVRYNFDHLDFSIIYNDVTGRVRAFNKYMSLFKSETNYFDGYFPIEEFWANDKVVKNANVITTQSNDNRYYKPGSQLSGPGMNSLSPTNPNDKIYMVRRWVELVGAVYKIKIGVKSFNYPNRFLDYDINLPDYCNEKYASPIIESFPGYTFTPYEINFSKPEISTYVVNVKAKGFKRPNGTTTPLSTNEIDLIENIAFIFEHLFQEEDFVTFITDNQLTFIFDKHFEIINSIFPSSVITENEYHKEFTPEFFALFRVRLLEFFYWAKGGGYFSVGKIKMLTRIFGLFDTETLRHLNYEEKVEILYSLVEDNWWISGRWWPSPSKYKLTEEETIVKLINSIAREVTPNVLNYTEINQFMDLLNNTPRYDQSGNYNFYQELYNRINDDVFFGDDGKGSRGKFVKAIYLLWLESKYNPNSQAMPNQSVLVNYSYTAYNAAWRFDDQSQPQTFDETASPNLINYESEKFLLWYSDNFNFPFSGKKIVAITEITKDFSELLLDAFQNTIIPFKPITPYKYIPYGYYEIFQPVSLRNTDPKDTIIRIPVAGNLSNPCAVNEGNNSNTLPIFYLKYIDDLGDISDFKESFGIILDVVLTFTGVGNITKARHLSKASVLRRYLLRETVSLVEKQLLMRAIRGVVFATWELVLGTASILFSVATSSCQDYNDPCNPPAQGTPEYEQFKRCQAIQKWLLALEIITLSGDLLAKRYFRKASRELDQALPPDFIDNLDQTHFDDFPAGADPDDVRPLIREAGDVDGLLDDFIANLDSAITDRLDSLNLSRERRIEFMNDFQNNPSGLTDLASNTHLIDEWSHVDDALAYFRRDPRYLRSCNRLTNKPHEVFHITDFINGSTTTGFDPKGAHAYKNIANGKISLLAPPGKPPTTIKHTKNGHVTYNNVYFLKPDGTYKKKSTQTIWNPSWDDNRIKNEMALALMNKKLIKPTQVVKNLPGFSPPPQYLNLYKSYLSDGTEVNLKIYNREWDIVNNRYEDDHLGYFELILK
jgi:hypothetical protein